MFFPGTVVGQTNEVSGSLSVSGDEVTRATFSVRLASITVGRRHERALDTSLDTEAHPDALWALTRPVRFSPAFVAGNTVRAGASGQLELRGVTRHVALVVTAGRDGTALEVAGSLPISLSRWDISRPAGFGPLGSLSGNGTAEFLLKLRRVPAH